MAIASVVTDGYSISGGYQGGVDTLARIGYSYQSIVVAGFICISTAILSVGYSPATISVGYSPATHAVGKATGVIRC